MLANVVSAWSGGPPHPRHLGTPPSGERDRGERGPQPGGAGPDGGAASPQKSKRPARVSEPAGTICLRVADERW